MSVNHNVSSVMFGPRRYSWTMRPGITMFRLFTNVVYILFKLRRSQSRCPSRGFFVRWLFVCRVTPVNLREVIQPRLPFTVAWTV